MKKTALIILNYNNAHDTRCCIESILAHNSAEVKIIVVDNDSRPEQLSQLKKDMNDVLPQGYEYYDSPDEVPSTLPFVSLIETHANLGYARGNNVGLEAAYKDDEIDYVMILNNDILFVEDIIPALLAKHKSLPDCAILSPVLYKKGLQEYDYDCARRELPVSALIARNFKHYWWKLRKKNFNEIYSELFILRDQSDKPEKYGGIKQPHSPAVVPSGSPLSLVEIQLPSGSCMLIRKDYFKSIGSFDPTTFLYYEENILHKKIAATGKKNYLSLDNRCIHLGASTTQSLPSSHYVMKEGKKSERYYVEHYSGASPFLKALHRLSCTFFMASFRLQKALTKKKG